MNKIKIIIGLSLVIVAFMPKDLPAQSYVNFSKYAGGIAQDDVSDMQVINGETYVIGITESANFPVTDGSVYKGSTDMVVTKYGVNGNILYATYLGSVGSDGFHTMQIINGEVYILGTADSIGYPVTNGSVFKAKLI